MGTIIEIGSPRLINGTVMGILYNKSIDDINLGHLADGLGYTAMGFVPLIVSFRFAGVYVMLERKSTLLITVRINKCINRKQWHILHVYTVYLYIKVTQRKLKMCHLLAVVLYIQVKMTCTIH